MTAPTMAHDPDDAELPVGDGARRVSLVDVKREPITWLWPGRLPAGKLVVLDGDPDLGKSTIALDLAARVSTGSPMPDGARLDAAADVILMSAEDGLADTIRPRLDAAGADCTRVHAFVEVDATNEDDEPYTRPPVIPADIGRLETMIADRGARLVIIDVFMAYLDSRVNAHHDQDVRRVLHQLKRLAERTGAVVLVLRHLNKSGGERSIYRGGGSIGIVGAARVGLLVGIDPDDENRRVLAVIKCNLAAKAPALGYRIVADEVFECGKVQWLGHTRHTADQLVEVTSTNREAKPREVATSFLKRLLAEGRELPVQQVKEATIAAGMSWATVRRAQVDLGIVPEHHGTVGDDEQWWSWALPEPQGAQSAPRRSTPEVEHLGHLGHLDGPTPPTGGDHAGGPAA